MIKADVTIVVDDNGNLYVNGVNIYFGAEDGGSVGFHVDGDHENKYGDLEQAVAYCLQQQTK